MNWIADAEMARAVVDRSIFFSSHFDFFLASFLSTGATSLNFDNGKIWSRSDFLKHAGQRGVLRSVLCSCMWAFYLRLIVQPKNPPRPAKLLSPAHLYIRVVCGISGSASMAFGNIEFGLGQSSLTPTSIESDPNIMLAHLFCACE
jgi:hypothetical protein